jgi:hypothetical protein
MDGVHSGQNEIKHHEEFDAVCMFADVSEVQAWDEVIFVMLVVFQEFDSEEYGADQFRQYEVNDEAIYLNTLRSMYGESHAKAAAQQHSRVQASKKDAQVAASFNEGVVIHPTVNDVREEYGTKEKHFGGQEYPHSCVGGILLLLDIVELVFS